MLTRVVSYGKVYPEEKGKKTEMADKKMRLPKGWRKVHRSDIVRQANRYVKLFGWSRSKALKAAWLDSRFFRVTRLPLVIKTRG